MNLQQITIFQVVVLKYALPPKSHFTNEWINGTRCLADGTCCVTISYYYDKSDSFYRCYKNSLWSLKITGAQDGIGTSTLYFNEFATDYLNY